SKSRPTSPISAFGRWSARRVTGRSAHPIRPARSWSSRPWLRPTSWSRSRRSRRSTIREPERPEASLHAVYSAVTSIQNGLSDRGSEVPMAVVGQHQAQAGGASSADAAPLIVLDRVQKQYANGTVALEDVAFE